MPADMPPNFYSAKRIVKPRRRTSKRLPVIAVFGKDVLTEQGEVSTLQVLIEVLPDLPPTIFATVGAADLLAYFDEIYRVSHPTTWQWRITDHDKAVYTPNGRLGHHHRVTTAVNFFGFKPGNYHKLIDPITMHGRDLSAVLPPAEHRIISLLQWAIDYRDFCADNGLHIRPTPGSIGAQLLRDPRFYPSPRRKVPAQTNARARDNLPGNHYHLCVTPSPSRTYSATYLDQHQAHHYHARQIHFPHADHLYAYGAFHMLEQYWRMEPGPNFMGLYCLDLAPPPVRGVPLFGLPYRSLDKLFIYSNELPAMLDMGYTVLGIRAGWGSTHRDTGLNKYAEWAGTELDARGNPRWLKMLLLATYGVLACKPTTAETIFRLAKKGIDTKTLTGRRSLTGQMVSRKQKLEPSIANVIHRGMIEAATRMESVTFAQYLTRYMQRVLHIYADGVIVEANDHPIPMLLEPWEIDIELTHYCPEGLQAFSSDQLTKRPGSHRPRDRRMVPVMPGGHRLVAGRTS